MAKHRKTKETSRDGGYGSPQRTRFEPEDWHAVAIMTVLVVVFFRDILLGNAFLWEDFLYYNYPARSFAASSMAMGQLPLWNPYTFGGMPFLADILTTVFYLPCTILALAVSNGQLHHYWLELVIILHYVLAGVSMYALAKSFGLRRTPSLFAGVAFMLTGFMIVHAIHQPVVTLAAWIPLIALLFRKVLLEPGWTWVFVASLVLGHSTLAGFPQLSLYIYSFLLVIFLFELFTTHRGAALLSRPALLMTARAATTILLSLTLASIQLLPTVELSSLSQRAEISYQKASEGALSWSQLLTTLYPKLFGSAGAEGYNYFGVGTYWNYWETCIYLGVLPFLLFILSFRLWKRNKYVPLLWIVGIVAILYALGGDFFLHRLLYDYVPGFSQFKSPGRMGLFFAFPAVLLSALSLQHLLYDEIAQKERSLLQRVVIIVAGTAAVVWVLVRTGVLDGTFTFLRHPQAGPMVVKEINLSLGVIGVSAAALLAVLRGTIWTRWIGMGLTGLVFLDLLLFGGSQNNAKLNPATYFSRTKAVVDFLKEEGRTEYFRVNTRNQSGMIMDRNQGMVDRIFLTEGYAPLALQRVFAPVRSTEMLFDLLNVKYKTVIDTPTQSLSFAVHPSYLPRAFFVYKLHVTHSEEELLALLKSSDFNYRTTAVLEKDPGIALPSDSSTPSWKAQITEYRNNSIVLDVETAQAGLLVLSEMFFPGWNAYIDGVETEIYRTDYNRRGMFVPQGAHRVELLFRPASFRNGLLLTLATLLVCGMGIGTSVQRSRRRTVQAPGGAVTL